MNSYFKANRKARKKYVKEFADVDYIDDLSPAHQEWLSKFLDEYYDNFFGADKIHSDADKKKIGQINNERRRDLYAIKRCAGFLDFDDKTEEQSFLTEDELIDLLDTGKK